MLEEITDYPLQEMLDLMHRKFMYTNNYRKFHKMPMLRYKNAVKVLRNRRNKDCRRKPEKTIKTEIKECV